MKRYLIIIIIVLAVTAAVSFGIGFFLLRSNSSTSVGTSGAASRTQIPNSTEVSVSTDPNTVSQSVTTSGSQSNAQSQDAVKAAFQSQSQIPADEKVSLYNTTFAGGYALQLWKGSAMGGEALLQYDATANNWNVLTDGGGAWNISDLVSFSGMATDTATTLLAGMPQ